MTDAVTDTSGWHESADIITDGGNKPCAERLFVHDCGAELKLFSGWAEEPGSMQWWWELSLSSRLSKTEPTAEETEPDFAWADHELVFKWGAP